jgi:hypothetical protein
VANGPLIPGMREFDTPRGGWPGWLVWTIVGAIVLALLVVVAGFVGGVGPLRTLGLSTSGLQAVQYRTTPNAEVIQVAVAMPPTGLCREDIVNVTAFERGSRVEIDSSVTRPRQATCPVSSIGGDVTWVDVPLDSPLGDRTVIRLPDRSPLTKVAAAEG